MTREEKAVVKAYIKMSYKKGWPRPTEYEMSILIDNMNSDSRDYMALFIEREWYNIDNIFKTREAAQRWIQVDCDLQDELYHQ